MAAAVMDRTLIQRIVLRLVSEFMLDRLHVLDTLFAARPLHGIVWVALGRNPGLGMSALATSLGVPVETVRRGQLVVRRATDGGEAEGRRLLADLAAEKRAGARALIAMAIELGKLGVTLTDFAGPADTQGSPFVGGEDFVQACERLSDDLFMRSCESALRAHGSVMQGLVFTAVLSLNAAPITHDPHLAWVFSGATTPPPQHVRQPCSVKAVAERVSIPRSTAQRQLDELVRRGSCDRTADGYLLTIAALQRPDVLQAGLDITVKTAQVIRAMEVMGLAHHAADGSGRAIEG